MLIAFVLNIRHSYSLASLLSAFPRSPQPTHSTKSQSEPRCCARSIIADDVTDDSELLAPL